MQLTKHHLLSTSSDPTVRFIHESRLHNAIKSRGRKWRPESTLVDIEAELTWESKFLYTGNLTSSHTSPVNFVYAPPKSKRKLIKKKE